MLPKIADRAIVVAEMDLPVPEFEIQERIVWKYGKADWDTLRSEFATTDDALQTPSLGTFFCHHPLLAC